MAENRLNSIFERDKKLERETDMRRSERVGGDENSKRDR